MASGHHAHGRCAASSAITVGRSRQPGRCSGVLADRRGWSGRWRSARWSPRRRRRRRRAASTSPPRRCSIDLTRLNPATGFKRLAPSQAGLNLVKTVIAATVVGAVAWSAVSAPAWPTRRASRCSHPVASRPGRLGARRGLPEARRASRCWRWRRPTSACRNGAPAQSLKMTKQEVKDDNKLAEGNPEIKARVRRVQREMIAQADARRGAQGHGRSSPTRRTLPLPCSTRAARRRPKSWPRAPTTWR